MAYRAWTDTTTSIQHDGGRYYDTSTSPTRSKAERTTAHIPPALFVGSRRRDMARVRVFTNDLQMLGPYAVVCQEQGMCNRFAAAYYVSCLYRHFWLTIPAVLLLPAFVSGRYELATPTVSHVRTAREALRNILDTRGGLGGRCGVHSASHAGWMCSRILPTYA